MFGAQKVNQIRKVGGEAAVRLAALLGALAGEQGEAPQGAGEAGFTYTPNEGVSQSKGDPNKMPPNVVRQDYPANQSSDVCKAVPNGSQTPPPLRFLRTLQGVAVSLIPSRELRRKVALVPILLPLELVGFHLGVSRQTANAWKRTLVEKGLLDARPYKVLVGGRVLNAGTLFLVPLRKGAKVRLQGIDFESVDTGAVVQQMEEGGLSYAWAQAFREKGLRPTLEVLSAWARGHRVLPGKAPPPDLNLIALLQEMAQDPERARGLPALITLLAQRIAELLGDLRSRRFYAGLLWAVAKGKLRADWLLVAIRRLQEGYREGVITKPGALLVSWLKGVAGM